MIKRTKAGRYSLQMTYTLREQVFSACLNFLEPEDATLMSVRMKTRDDIMRHLYASVLNELIVRTNWQLQNHLTKNVIITRSEAIALMWLLREYDHEARLLELKSHLHKHLGR